METLERLKVADRPWRLIQSFYNEPKFKVSMNGIDSDFKPEASYGCSFRRRQGRA